LIISAEAQAGLSSYARHVAATHARYAADGSVINVDLVAVYLVYHDILEPWQIQLGLDSDDILTYQMNFLGQYQRDGVRRDIFAPKGQIAASARLLAEYLLYDVGKKTVGLSADDRRAFVAEMKLPVPWQKFLAQFPDLINQLPAPAETDDERRAQLDQLKQRIEKHVQERFKSAGAE
jgi:hypothetical protein